ncbi:MAG: DUF3024 domain-containing protein [bacterium]
MAFSEIELKKIDKLVGGLCRERIPVHLKDQLSLEYRVKGHEVVVYERRPYWSDPNEITETPVAKMKFLRTTNEWRLYWMRRDLKWHGYDMLKGHRNRIVMDCKIYSLASPLPDFPELK